MDVALGWKARSGWAALVVLAAARGALEVVDRRRVELVDPGDAPWAKQPYHAAEGLYPDDARDVVARAIAAAKRHALREMKAAVARAEGDAHRVVACAVLTGSGMPAWSTDEILSVHFRMHKAEGELFRGVLADAARDCALRFVPVPEKTVGAHAAEALGVPAATLAKEMQALGKAVGAPWGQDQKQAALAARVALEGRRRKQA
jgi:hypothetical protein